MSADSRDEVSFRPCMLIAHGDPFRAAQLDRAFRRQGWDVYVARTGPEARRLARLLTPELVILDTDLPGESGWLTCDKLTRESAPLKVFLIGDPTQPRSEAFAQFAGAVALVPPNDVVRLVHDICARVLPAAS